MDPWKQQCGEATATLLHSLTAIHIGDGGGEYRSTALQDYFKSKGIHHEMTNAYTPQENSVSERMNCILVKMARAMLFDAGLPNAYWGDAILYAMHILNHVPTHAIADRLTPHEVFTGNRPSVVHLRIFRCKAHVHVPDEKWWKLDTKSIECIFLGFTENRKACVCMHHLSGHILSRFRQRKCQCSLSRENRLFKPKR